MAWRNGYIPESDLVIFQRGRNNVDGDWYWGLTPGTYAKHLALVARAKARTGRTLSPSDGWGTYRPYAGQVIARRIYGNGAAVPGTSSHGGFWEGRETLAIDYGNWGYVYNWDRAAFYADCWAVGLTPGMIEPRRGYPDEPWHVIDLNPRDPAPAVAGNVTPSEEDELMGAKEDIISAVTQLEAKLHDRRDVVVAWTPAYGDVPRTAWVVDHGAGTKRNVAKGQPDYPSARAYIDWLVAQGIQELPGDQAPQVLAGYRDITDVK